MYMLTHLALFAAGISAAALPNYPGGNGGPPSDGSEGGPPAGYGQGPPPSVVTMTEIANGPQPSGSYGAGRPSGIPEEGSGPSQTYSGNSPSQVYGGNRPSQTYADSGASQTYGGSVPSAVYGGGGSSQMYGGTQPSQTYGAGDDTPSQTGGDYAQPSSTAPSDSSGGSGSGSSGDSAGCMSVIQTLDSAYGISKSWDQQLADNAYKTVYDGEGRSMNHELNPGSMGQVLAPGSSSSFETAYYAWLCEKSSDTQLAGACGSKLSGSGFNADGGDTGHHDILTDGKYTKIGCAFYADPNNANGDGLWGCDVS